MIPSVEPFCKILVRTEVLKNIESICMLEYLSVPEKTRNQMEEAMKSDPTMLSLLETVKSGWPEDKNTLPSGVQQYYNFKEELTTQNGLLFKGNRLPYQLVTEEIMSKLHASHSGINRSLRRKRELIYWLGMYKEVEDYVKCCSVCH